MSFSFGFSGDDIERDENDVALDNEPGSTSSGPPQQQSAFPVPGKPQLPATQHHLSDLISSLPSKIAYGLLDVNLDEDGSRWPSMQLPRRELWDVRVQLMAEDDEVTGNDNLVDDGGLGKHDVKTGIYEGGFKSWESSVDLVKILAAQDHLTPTEEETSTLRVVELGCGTGLPSLALFQWIMAISTQQQQQQHSYSLVLADYNPSVLRLVTMPNFLLAWALSHKQTAVLQDAFSIEGELELSPEILEAFQQFLAQNNIQLSFISGAWSPEFVQILYSLPAFAPSSLSATTLLLGAETIYSPFALRAFTEVLFTIIERERNTPGAKAPAYIAAKRLYFGVGGSLTDFIDIARSRGAVITELREETEGVRRGVVHCALPF
ncbi:Mitotic exit network interactor 1 [Cladobotryum mycophilum]|uniref:protein-histidine N-methyltransferase n=1 Tax=Cladobotryum mycophilum TaxID=491253 RepID=A0ABR0S6W0_9HYPO